MNDRHYIYHIRNPETSSGFGFDGYVGTTNCPKRRFNEHMRAAAAGRHSNPKFQKDYDEAKDKLQMSIVRMGPKDEIMASEALVINRPNKHLNIQMGGGHLRGRSEEELLKLFRLAKES